MLVDMFIHPLTLVVVSANVFGVAMAVPQAHKILRSRRVDGVSLTWATASGVVNAWWGAYGLGVGDVGILPVSIVSVMAYVLIGVSVVRYSPTRAAELLRPALATGAAMTAVPLVTLVIEGWVATGVVLGALYGVQLSPAVIAVYRSADVSGVSLSTWVFAFAEAVLWGVYGVAGLDAGLIALAFAGTTMSALVLARLFVRRRLDAGEAVPVGIPGLAAA